MTTINTFDLLNEYDLNNLDAYEANLYYDLIGKMSKENALQIIINSVEGDYSQLSSELALIAELIDEN